MGAQKTQNVFSGEWGRVYVEKVTAGENSVENMSSATTYISSLREDTSGVVFGMYRINSESPSPAFNEFGGGRLASESSVNLARYRNGSWSYGIGNSYQWDAHITKGSVFYVLSIEINFPFE